MKQTKNIWFVLYSPQALEESFHEIKKYKMPHFFPPKLLVNLMEYESGFLKELVKYRNTPLFYSLNTFRTFCLETLVREECCG